MLQHSRNVFISKWIAIIKPQMILKYYNILAKFVMLVFRWRKATGAKKADATTTLLKQWNDGNENQLNHAKSIPPIGISMVSNYSVDMEFHVNWPKVIRRVYGMIARPPIQPIISIFDSLAAEIENSCKPFSFLATPHFRSNRKLSAVNAKHSVQVSSDEK